MDDEGARREDVRVLGGGDDDDDDWRHGRVDDVGESSTRCRAGGLTTRAQPH